MNKPRYRRLRFALAVPAGLLSLPPLLLGFYLLFCWVRIHTTDVYYVDYPYLFSAAVFLGVGVFSAFCTCLSVIRRSYFGIGFILPLFIGLATAVYIPDGTPHVQRSMIRDSNYMSSINSFFRVWYEEHQSFPSNEAEFMEALRTGPKAWQNRVQAPEPLSDYAKKGVRLPYNIVVVQNASGPRTDNLSSRPGVVYYCVSPDKQQFWATMTALQDDVSRSASLSRVADLPYERPRLATAKGKD